MPGRGGRSSLATRVGAKGQVVIPKRVRDQLGIQPGDQMRFWIEGDHLAAEPARQAATGEPLLGRFAGSCLTELLEQSRQSNRDRAIATTRTLRSDPELLVVPEPALGLPPWSFIDLR